MKRVTFLVFSAFLLSTSAFSTQQFEEANEIGGSSFKATPSLTQMIQRDELEDILKASKNALETCGPFAVCKGTYKNYSVFVNKENNILMSFMRNHSNK